MNDAPARQVIGKIAARLAPREALHRTAGGLGLGLILAGRSGQFLELQFQLIDQRPVDGFLLRPGDTVWVSLGRKIDTIERADECEVLCIDIWPVSARSNAGDAGPFQHHVLKRGVEIGTGHRRRVKHQ